MTIGDRIGNRGIRLPDTTDRLVSSTIFTGVEIEMERVRSGSLQPFGGRQSWWTTCTDGSLRNNGREFKFAEPLAGKDIVDAVEYFYANRHPEWEVSYRCGLHVHIDVRDLSDKEWAVMQQHALAVDEWLFDSTGSEWRKGAQFCRMSSGNHHIIGAARYNTLAAWNPRDYEIDTRRMGWGREVRNNEWKYHSINFQFTNFGTVEFRHFGVPDTAEEMLSIIDKCLAVKHSARLDCARMPSSSDVLDISKHESFAALFPECVDGLSCILTKCSI